MASVPPESRCQHLLAAVRADYARAVTRNYLAVKVGKDICYNPDDPDATQHLHGRQHTFFVHHKDLENWPRPLRRRFQEAMETPRRTVSLPDDNPGAFNTLHRMVRRKFTAKDARAMSLPEIFNAVAFACAYGLDGKICDWREIWVAKAHERQAREGPLSYADSMCTFYIFRKFAHKGDEREKHGLFRYAAWTLTKWACDTTEKTPESDSPKLQFYCGYPQIREKIKNSLMVKRQRIVQDIFDAARGKFKVIPSEPRHEQWPLRLTNFECKIRKGLASDSKADGKTDKSDKNISNFFRKLIRKVKSARLQHREASKQDACEKLACESVVSALDRVGLWPVPLHWPGTPRELCEILEKRASLVTGAHPEHRGICAPEQGSRVGDDGDGRWCFIYRGFINRFIVGRRDGH